MTKLMSAKLNDKIAICITAVLLLCSNVLREIVALVIPDRSATVTALILLFSIMIYLFLTDLTVRKIQVITFPIIAVFLAIFMTWIINPERHDFYKTSLYKIWEILFPTSCIYALPIMLLLEDDDQRLKVFKCVAFIQYFWSWIQARDVLEDGLWTRGSIYNGEIVQITVNYNLNWGYNLLIPCILFTGICIIEKKKVYIPLILAGLIGIFLYGSRGPLLVYLILLLLLYLYGANKNRGYKVVILSLSAITVMVLLESGIINSLLQYIALNSNTSSRTLEKLLDGSLSSDSGRSNIYNTVFSLIFKNPITGYGIYADRFYMNMMVQGGSAYSHNVFLELWLSFGLIGVAIFILIIYRIIFILQIESDKIHRVMLLSCIGCCIPLMMSLTFWNHSMFWVLLALLIGYNKKRRIGD